MQLSCSTQELHSSKAITSLEALKTLSLLVWCVRSLKTGFKPELRNIHPNYYYGFSYLGELRGIYWSQLKLLL